MNSQQLENNLTKTSCKNCILSVYNNNTQTGCLVNRIDSFKSLDENLVIEAYDEEKEFFVINRLCNYYRDKSWNDGVVDEKKIKYEAKVNFDLIIDCKDFDDTDFNKLHGLHEQIIDYGNLKIKMSIFINKAPNIRKIFDSRLQLDNPKITVYFDKFNPHDDIIRTKKSYHIIVNKNNIDQANIFNKLNSLINDNLQRIIVFENNNVLAISNLAYKIESFKLESTNYNTIVEEVIKKSKQDNYYYKT